MRFMSLWRPKSQHEMNFEKMQKLVDDEMKSGRLVATGGWDVRTPAIVVRSDASKVTVTDGPFAEAKEAIGGYAILEVASKEELLEATKQFLAIAGDGVCEIRELGAPPPAAKR
jgi:hypothetical protein